MRQTYKHDLFYSIIATFQAVEERLTKKCLTDEKHSPYSISTVAKSIVGCGSPYLSSKANEEYTPQACFFICSTNTSKASQIRLVLSMMAFDGQRSIVGCFPLMAVLPPHQTLSPYTVEGVSDSSSKFIKGLSAMIYLFLAVDRYSDTYSEKIIRVEAPDRTTARLSLSAQWRLLVDFPIKQYPRHKETDFYPPLHTDCNRSNRMRKPSRLERAEMALKQFLSPISSAQSMEVH